MSPSRALITIAWCVDALLRQPGAMAATRAHAEACLANPDEGHADLLFLDHPDDPDGVDEETNLTSPQRALLFAALHDACCPRVEKVISLSADLRWAAVEADPGLRPAWSREFQWLAIRDSALSLGDWALCWLESQLAHFQQELAERLPPLPMSLPPEGGISVGVSTAETNRRVGMMPAANGAGDGASPVLPQYVTLDQMAASVSRSKKALERAMNRTGSTMPRPDVEGGGGKPHEWLWSRIRPWLEKEYGRKLPEHFPACR